VALNTINQTYFITELTVVKKKKRHFITYEANTYIFV